MAQLVLPNGSPAWLALREPNLLVPGVKPKNKIPAFNGNIWRGLKAYYDFTTTLTPLFGAFDTAGITGSASNIVGTNKGLAYDVPAASTDYISIANVPEDNSFTFEYYLIPTSYTNEQFYRYAFSGYIESPGSGTKDRALHVFSNNWYFSVYDGAIKTLSSTTPVVLNKAALIHATLDGSTLRLYRDGLEIGSIAASGAFGGYASPEWIFGEYENGGNAAKWLHAAYWDRALTATECHQRAAQIYPAEVWANQSPFLIGVTAAGGDVNIAVTTGALTIAGVNAAISQAKNISVTTGALTIAGVNAVVLNGQEVSVTTGALTIAATNASIQQDNNISVGVGALTIAGANTTVEKNLSVSAGTGALTIAGVNAVIDQQAAGVNNIIVTTGALTVSGTGVAINQVSNLSIGTGSITVAGINAAVAQNKAVSAGVGALSIAGVNAVVLSGQQVSVGTGALTIAGVDANIINVSSVLSTGIETLTARTLGGYQARSVN